MRNNSAAFGSGAIIGTLGGLIGLGGAEFRLPLLISLFRFRGLEAVILNKVDMPLGPSGIERLLATLSHERRCHERLRRIAYAIRTSEHIMPAMNGELLKRV